MEKVITILSRKQPYFNTVSSDTLVSEALHQMNCENANYLIVMDDDRFLGVLTQHDITSKAMANPFSLNQLTVMELLNKGRPIVDADESVEYCLKLMQLFKVHYLPVFEKFRFCGIISSDDILNEALSNRRKIFDEEKDKDISYSDY